MSALGKMAGAAGALVPGAVPAAAASGGLVMGAMAGAPPWLVALGQAAIVALWCSHAARQQAAAFAAKLADLEDAVRGLECVRARRVAALEGATPPPPPCEAK